MSGRNNGKGTAKSSGAHGLKDNFQQLSPAELRKVKTALLNTVSAALINNPRFDVTAEVFVRIADLIKTISFYDPEFVLKMGLYVRSDLNIRTTANYIVALAANIPACQPFVRKYLCHIVRLPSDWLDVAATYNILPDKALSGKAVPTCLRKAMCDKFPSFDAYQLGKYNKERSVKRKLKKMREEKQKNPDRFTKPQKPMLTIKQMIRHLHVSSPVFPVMCILGKKYPENDSQFAMSGLPGRFDPELAGKRMKLPTPETWETLLSEKGNKAATWEELIEHKKLPFMAMLRNLRNLIFAGVHPKYHKWAQNRLSNEVAVRNSRQFPFRFFSAYEVIPRDLAHFKQLIEQQNSGKRGADDGKKRRQRKKPIIPAHMPPDYVFANYRAALDSAVKLATVHNVSPIRGSTVVFCNVGAGSDADCSGARGMGNSVRKIQEVGYLLGLMCKYVCEDCDFRIFSAPSTAYPNGLSVELKEGTILDNMNLVSAQATNLDQSRQGQFPYQYLSDLVLKRKRIDNIVVLSHTPMNPSDGSQSQLGNLLKKYRQEVNEDLLFVSVDLSGKGRPSLDQDEQSPNDLLVTGFSDQILRFIAEKGDNQLQYVENIDEAKGVKNLNVKREIESSPWWTWLEKMGEAVPSPVNYPNITIGKPWREVRVFISSTFRDMHGERDFLTRKIFPELKQRCMQRRINLVEVDLRWGVTEEESQLGKSLELCLDEVERCRPFFIGMLGNRYGWAPKEYEGLPDHPRFEWVKNYPAGRSITELEMQLAALQDPSKASGACFFLRNDDIKVPEKYARDFKDTNAESHKKLTDLKNRIRSSGLNVLDNYPATWGGEVEGKPVVTGLEVFGQNVFNWLWSAIDTQYPAAPDTKDALEKERNYHQMYAYDRSRRFIGRKSELASLEKFANNDKSKLLAVTGEPGDGKSALLATFSKRFAETHPNTFVLTHYIGSSPGSTNITRTLDRLCREICAAFSLDIEIPAGYRDLVKIFPTILEEASFQGKLIVVLDGIDQLNDSIENAHSLDWLPKSAPCQFMLSFNNGAPLSAFKRRHSKVIDVQMTKLDVKTRTEIVRETLWDYHKKLDERPMNNQMRVLLRKPEAYKPLYLMVACEELRIFGVYELVTKAIRDMGGKIHQLFDQVLRRLETDHTKPVVELTLAAIACSRGGIPKETLERLLLDNITGFTTEKWLTLYQALGSFLKETGPASDCTLNFFHNELTKAVQKRYTSRTRRKNVTKIHVKLATHYNTLVVDENKKLLPSPNTHAVSEVVYHACLAERNDLFSALLTNLSFVELKVSLGMSFDLLADYNRAVSKEQGPYDKRKEVKEFMRFFQSNAFTLHKSPALVFQQAINQPDDSAPSKEASELWNEELHNGQWFKWLNKPQEHNSCKMTFSGFQGAVTATTVSPDGTMIACALKDCSIKIYDAHTGAEICTLTGHTNAIPVLLFSYDSRQLVSGSWDKTIKLWDLYVKAEITTLKGHNRRVNDVAYSNDGRYLLSASWDCHLKYWDAIEGKPLRKWFNFPKSRPLNSCTFSPDDKQVIAASWDGDITIFNVEDGALLRTLSGHEGSIRSLSMSPSGKHIVSGGLDNKMILWDAAAGKVISKLSAHAKPINCVTYSADGQQVVSASDDSTLKVWNANLGKEIQTIKIKEGYFNCVCFNPSQGNLVVTGSSDCIVSVWDLEKPEEPLWSATAHNRPITYAEFSYDGRYVASCSEDGLVVIWNASSGAVERELKGHRSAVNSLSWAPISGDYRLATGSDDFSIRVWNAATGESACEEELVGHDSVVRSVSFAPNGKHILSASRDKTLRLWDARNGHCLKVINAHMDWINCCHMSNDSNRVISSSWDYNLKLWNMRKTKEIATMAGHESAVVFCRFSPTGEHIVSASYDGSLKIWDAKSCTEITTLKGHEMRINGVAFSPDGKRIASVSDDHTLKIWNPLAATEVATLTGHADSVLSANFDPVTKQIVSASKDGTMKMWNAGIGDDKDDDDDVGGYGFTSSFSLTVDEPEEEVVLETLEGHPGYVNNVDITSSGKAVTASDDGTAIVWNLETGLKMRTFTHGENIPVRDAKFSSNGSLIVTAADNKLLKLWDIRQGNTAVATFTGHNAPVWSCGFDSSGSKIISGGWDNQVIVWSVGSRSKQRVMTGHTDWITKVCFSPNGRFCASASYDDTVRLWNPSNGVLAFQIPAHTNCVTDLAFSPDSNSLASCSEDGSIRVSSVNSPNNSSITLLGQGRLSGVTFMPAVNTELLSVGGTTLRAWNTRTRKSTGEFVTSAPLTSVASATVSGKKHIIAANTVGQLFSLTIQRP